MIASLTAATMLHPMHNANPLSATPFTPALDPFGQDSMHFSNEPEELDQMQLLGQLASPDMQAVMLLLAMMLANARHQGMSSPLNGATRGEEPGAPQGGYVDLKEGDSFTTPSGSTISWKGDEVKIHETGESVSSGAGATANQAGGAANPGRQFALILASAASASASSASGEGGSASASASASTALQTALMSFGPMLGGATGSSSASAAAAADLKPRDWRVWGDPHIDHPDGSKSDFDKKNALFTLQDGTRVLMGADNPQGVVKSVRIFLPGARVNLGQLEPAQTSIMQDKNGRFEPMGTADQFMGRMR
ncbi:MAG: hypothetical protein AMXMBFR33_25250 [Candidatus Xenobia bacterium]